MVEMASLCYLGQLSELYAMRQRAGASGARVKVRCLKTYIKGADKWR